MILPSACRLWQVDQPGPHRKSSGDPPRQHHHSIYGARDTYDHAFVLPALSNVGRLSGDAQVQDEVESFAFFGRDPAIASQPERVLS